MFSQRCILSTVILDWARNVFTKKHYFQRCHCSSFQTMCRFAVYVSPQKPICLADLLTRPTHSIVKQSYGSTERTVHHEIPAALNADGFGVAWYPVKPSDPSKHNKSDMNMEESCLFRSVLPAWNDKNLHRISAKIESSLIFAHVRAASPGSNVNQPNCHPFVCGKYTFMHNGGIACFGKLKKHIVMQLSAVCK